MYYYLFISWEVPYLLANANQLNHTSGFAFRLFDRLHFLFVLYYIDIDSSSSSFFFPFFPFFLHHSHIHPQCPPNKKSKPQTYPRGCPPSPPPPPSSPHPSSHSHSHLQQQQKLSPAPPQLCTMQHPTSRLSVGCKFKKCWRIR